MRICIMITTRNRVAELQRTCAVIRQLEPPPHQVLVTADGCTDDTISYLQGEHPGFCLTINAPGKGSVASRAAMMQQASGDLVLALDDDSYPEQMDCLATLARYFEANPRMAVATFPQRTDEYPKSLRQEYFGAERPVRSFPNSGACLRVSAYRELPGFESMFFHAYEEPDYALQCVAAGWEVRLLPQITIRHHYSGVARNELRIHQYHARNEFWSTVMRCPLPYALGFAAYRIFSQARYAAGRGPGWLIREPVWWWRALRGLPLALRRRRVVSWAGYKRWLQLRGG